MIKIISRLITSCFFCTFLLSCSQLSFQATDNKIIDTDIQHIIAHYQSRGDLNSQEKAIIQKMAHTFLLTIKTQLAENKWHEFYNKAMASEQTIERSLIDTYGELLYSLGGEMFYATDMPYERQTQYEVSQAGFANILYLNDTSLKDKAEIEYIFDYSSQAIKDLFLNNKSDLEGFEAKLNLMNDGYINVLLVSNETQKEAYGLNYATAYSKNTYGFTPRELKYNNWIESKYVNLLYSVSFLHELVHSFLSLQHINIEDMEFDRNNYATIKGKLKISPHKNIMLEEGLAEYITRNHSVWSKLPIFEPVQIELKHMHKQGLALLNLGDMKRYYYGKEQRSFEYVQYGLLSAHSLVDFLVQRYDINTVIELIYLDNIENNAEALLGIPWTVLIDEWHAQVSDQ